MGYSQWLGRLLSLTLLANAPASPLASPPRPSLPPAAASSIDTLITGARVIDGTGGPERRVDVGISGERIVFVGERPPGVSARRIIEAAGLIVAPGFIDPHTHSGGDALSEDRDLRVLPNHLLQGVTSIVIGNDGGGESDVRSIFDRVAALGTGPNVASFAGFGTIRRAIVGQGAQAPTSEQLQRMEALVGSAMCHGALGLSAGLYYAPQSFARIEEVAALAKIAGRRGGVYETHLRDEGSSSIGLMPAIEEALSIARAGELPLHIAHIKALGKDVHGTAPLVIARIQRARAEGTRVTADQYPWEASSTRLASALVARWAMDGGRAAMIVRLKEGSPRLHADMAEQLRVRGGAGTLLLVDGKYRGKRLDGLAAAWKLAPVDAAIRLLIEEPRAGIASFNMTKSDIEAFARQPWVVAGSDASKGHPRAFGSFARRWRLFVRERAILTKTEFVHRASGLTAQIFGIADRGSLAPGNFADIAIFDPATYAERATYDAPERAAIGVRHVFVGGRLAVENGRVTGLLAGRPLPKPRQNDWNCAS